MNTAKQMYERRINNYGKLLQKQKKVEGQISNLRLVFFIIGIAAVILTYLIHHYILLIISLIVFATTFIYLVIWHGKVINNMKYTTLLYDINTHSLKRINGEWNTFTDSGQEFVDTIHNYTFDLDIFGKGSLYQWINATNTYRGRYMLKDLLSGDISSSNEIKERQKAVYELAPMLNWRQRFSAEGMTASAKMVDPEELIRWAESSNKFYRKTSVNIMFKICPIITGLLVLSGLIMNIISWVWPATALLIQFGMVSYKGAERYRMFAVFENYDKDLRAYYKMLRHFEKRSFKSPYINSIKNQIVGTDVEAYKQLDVLSSIVDSLSNRRNSFYLIFNTLALWDFQKIIALEKWKEKSGSKLKYWFEALGKMEALASLSILPFENPDWALPIIHDGEQAEYEAVRIGHPLLGSKKVYNDLSIERKGTVLLITGSNMSGKSTLLRTAGINLVLAYAGAPVCAKSFRASTMGIYTCMRVSDNLGESVSSFYAELLRIKRIVTEADSGNKIFFLLDEIFKGTNSLDRHTGARVLINKLSGTNSIGMVSTHDLELCDLEKVNGKISNYHFQEYYKDKKICFDYKLRKGPSTTRNAVYLMQLAGIEIDEQIK